MQYNPPYKSMPQDGLSWAIFLLAFLLRWPFSSPEWAHVDERALVLYPLGFWSGDFNPHFFNYPTFTLYLVSALYYVYYLLFSAESLEYFVAYRYFVDPTDLLTIARTTNSLLSAGTVSLCIAIGGRLYGRTGGYLAGLILAVMPLHARFAHLAITDVSAGFFTALAVLYGVRIAQGGRWGDMALAGIFAGLAAASKYPAGLVLGPVLLACFLHRSAWRRQPWSSLWSWCLPVATAALSFAVVCPHVLLNWQSFVQAFAEMAAEHLLSTVHTSDEPAWWYWVRHNFRYGLGWAGLPILALSLFWPTTGRRREEWVVIAGVALFAALLFGSSSVFMRYAQPLAPLLAILLARSGAALVDRRRLLLVWFVLLTAEPLYATLQQRILLGGEDTREQARAWLKEHTPGGQRYLQFPKAAGQIPALRPEQVFVRMDPFILSYGIDQLEDSFRLLGEGPKLPGLFMDWTLANYRSLESSGDANGKIYVCFYQHPLAKMSHNDSLARALIEDQVDWQVSFGNGGAVNAAFDEVDWHFVPIGDFGKIERSGPEIRIGTMPWYGREPLPSGNALFKAYSLLLAGNKAVKDERWHEGAAAYEALIETPYLLNELFTGKYLYQIFIGSGQALAGLGDTEGAEQAWLRAAKIQPIRGDPYFNLGLMFAELGQHQRSVEYYAKAAELDPDDAITLYNWGLGLFKLGRLQECIAILESAADLDAKVETLLNLTVAYGRSGQLDRARAAFARAHELDPQHPQVLAIARTIQR